MADRIVVDTHVHLYRTKEEGGLAKAAYGIWEYGSMPSVHFSSHPGDVESAGLAIEAAGVRRAVVANLLDRPRAGIEPAQDLKAYNAWLCDLAAHDERFVPLIGLDPNHLSVEDAVAHLEDMVLNHGAVGIKIHPPLQHFDLGNRDLWPIFEACRRLDVVVVSHSGPSRDGRPYGEPDSFRPLLAAYPDLRLVLAHLGGGTWSQVPGIARDFPGVRFDLCEIVEWIGAPQAPNRDQFVRLLRDVGADRVFMGSDFPWYDIDHTIGAVLDLPLLSPSEQDAILGENAAEFFRLAI
jgi:predicted TIM-barrel fold metal-dependent hydrolase